MIAFDTNILVYAHRRDSPFHEAASAVIREWAEGGDPWALLWPCLHEFIAIATNPRIFKQPTPLANAIDQVEAWLESPRVVVLGEDQGYWEIQKRLLERSRVQGARVHDARIAALVVLHRISELLTADRDFSRFPEVRTRNPVA